VIQVGNGFKERIPDPIDYLFGWDFYSRNQKMNGARMIAIGRDVGSGRKRIRSSSKENGQASNATATFLIFFFFFFSYI